MDEENVRVMATNIDDGQRVNVVLEDYGNYANFDFTGANFTGADLVNANFVFDANDEFNPAILKNVTWPDWASNVVYDSVILTKNQMIDLNESNSSPENNRIFNTIVDPDNPERRGFNVFMENLSWERHANQQGGKRRKRRRTNKRRKTNRRRKTNKSGKRRYRK